MLQNRRIVCVYCDGYAATVVMFNWWILCAFLRVGTVQKTTQEALRKWWRRIGMLWFLYEIESTCHKVWWSKQTTRSFVTWRKTSPNSWRNVDERIWHRSAMWNAEVVWSLLVVLIYLDTSQMTGESLLVTMSLLLWQPASLCPGWNADTLETPTWSVLWQGVQDCTSGCPRTSRTD